MMRVTSSAWMAIAASQFLSSAALAQESYSSSWMASTTSSSTASSSVASSTAWSSTASSSTASSLPTPSKEPKVHLVKVGAGGFKFSPQEIHNVSVGDIISWEFYPSGHSVARAEYGSACVPYEDTGKDKEGFWSGPQVVKNTNELTHFNITINSTEPIFFYCAAPNSCKGEHMVGAINPNSTQTLASQVQAAAQADFQIAPGEPVPAEASSTLSTYHEPTGSPKPNEYDEYHSSPSLSGGAIAGIVVGSVAFLVVCAALFFFVGRSKSLKDLLKRQNAPNNGDGQMSQPYGGGMPYGDGGLASPGFQPSRPGNATPPPPPPPPAGHHAEYGFGSPPQYGQHSVSEQYPSGWVSPTVHQGHLSMMSNTSGMSQQQMEQLKYAHMTAQPAPAELHSPPLHHQSFSAELEAPNSKKSR